MTRDDDLRIRLGRIRSRGSRSRPFIAQALAAAEKAGGLAHPTAKQHELATSDVAGPRVSLPRA